MNAHSDDHTLDGLSLFYSLKNAKKNISEPFCACGHIRGLPANRKGKKKSRQCQSG